MLLSILVAKLYFGLLTTLILITASCGLYSDFVDNTELIQQRSGDDVKLNCDIERLVTIDKMKDIKIFWFFKKCSDRLINPYMCESFQTEEWTQLPCEENFCNPDLILRNVTKKYSGLYKCTIYPYRLHESETLDIQLVRTYHLEIKNASRPVPEFLDALPTNKTAIVGIQAVFQCRVYSEVHPTIKWFRRISEQSGPKEYMLDTEIFNSHIVQHNGHTYELLDVAKEKLISDETYLSKLILNGIRLQDEGFYACVAINYHGYNVREAYLHLKNTESEENHSEQHEHHSDIRTDPIEFWLLFLMPLGLAILPISVWVCYIIFKKSRHNEIVSAGTQHRYEYSDENLKAEKWMLRA